MKIMSSQSPNKTKWIAVLASLLFGLCGYFWGRIVETENYLFIEIFSIRSGEFKSIESKESPSVSISKIEKKATVDIIMLGDSITKAGKWNELFPDLNITNMGINGNTTYDVLGRLDSVTSLMPKKVFLMMGVNDINTGHEVDSIVENYTRIVQRLQNKGIKVYIQSTVECSKVNCEKKLSQIRDLNSKLISLASTKKLIFIDINKGITNANKGLVKSYTYDGLHLVDTAYSKWSKAIAPFMLS